MRCKARIAVRGALVVVPVLPPPCIKAIPPALVGNTTSNSTSSGVKERTQIRSLCFNVPSDRARRYAEPKYISVTRCSSDAISNSASCVSSNGTFPTKRYPPPMSNNGCPKRPLIRLIFKSTTGRSFPSTMSLLRCTFAGSFIFPGAGMRNQVPATPAI